MTDEMADLDPGIRDVVLALRAEGFHTSDSGDGVSKPADWYALGEAIPYPHVVCRSYPAVMVAEANRLHNTLREMFGEGWHIEATYSPSDRVTTLLALKR